MRHWRPWIALGLLVGTFATPVEALSAPTSAAASDALEFTSPAQATAYVGVPFTFDPYARLDTPFQFGTPFYNVSGNLPPGVEYSPLVGIAGTAAPGSEGTYHLTFDAVELNVASAEQNFTLTVTSSSAPATLPSLNPPAVTPKLGHVPAAVSYAHGSDHATLDNDTLGDCVEVAEAHLAQDQAAAVGVPAPRASVAQIISTYYTLTGGQAGPEVGTNDWQAFALWKQSGLAGTRLVAVSQLADPHSRLALEQAVSELGGALAYVRVPSVDRPQQGIAAAHVWTASDSASDKPKLPHELAVVGYDQTGPLLSTWGRVQQATWSWWSHYAVGVYPVITQALIQAGHGPSGIPVRTLLHAWSGTARSTTSAAPAPPLSY